MKKNDYFCFNYLNQRSAAEYGESIVKQILWCALIVASLLVMQDRLNVDAEKFQKEQAAIRAASCN